MLVTLQPLICAVMSLFFASLIPVGIVRGLSDGIYYFPKNIIDTEKINGEWKIIYSNLKFNVSYNLTTDSGVISFVKKTLDFIKCNSFIFFVYY